MSRTYAFFICLCLAGCSWSAPVEAQKIAGGLSERQISINSSFAGEVLTLFGNVEPQTGSTQKYVEGPFDIVVVVTGPALDRVARRKTNNFGLWINTEELVFTNFPSFKWVLSSGHLTDIASEAVLEDLNIPLNRFPDLVKTHGNGNSEILGNELVRLMTERGLFGLDERGVVFQSGTLYSVQIPLPADVPNGTFLAESFLFQNGKLLAHKGERFAVRKTGFERFVGDSARNDPVLYGLAAVFLAMFTGWLGGAVFRR